MDVAAMTTRMASINVAQQVSISAVKRALDQMELMGEFITEMAQTSAAPVDVSTIDIRL
jgi:hypothetical protein